MKRAEVGLVLRHLLGDVAGLTFRVEASSREPTSADASVVGEHYPPASGILEDTACVSISAARWTRVPRELRSVARALRSAKETPADRRRRPRS